MSETIDRALAQWSKGVSSEVQFWRTWLATRGANWAWEYEDRLNPDCRLDGRLDAALAGVDGVARVLDVGAGPLTAVGKMRRGAPIDLVASDPLARVYEALLAEANLAPPVRTTFALAEDLSVFFDHSSFDAVHCRNALDHSFDPMKGVLEMLRVVRPGRAVVLIHRQNEAESENYTGFHQYNFSMNAGRFTIWNKSETWDVAEQIPIRVQIECETAHGMINVRITKQEEFTDSDDRSRHRLRLRAMLTAMFDHIIDRETAGVPAQALPD